MVEPYGLGAGHEIPIGDEIHAPQVTRKESEHRGQSVAVFVWSPDGKAVAARVSVGGPANQAQPGSQYLDLVGMEPGREGALIQSISWPEHLLVAIPFAWR